MDTRDKIKEEISKWEKEVIRPKRKSIKGNWRCKSKT